MKLEEEEGTWIVIIGGMALNGKERTLEDADMKMNRKPKRRG